MKIEPHYRIESTCAPDGTRPGLYYVNITTYDGKPVAVSADGFVLACVPVEMEYDDVPGLLDPVILKRARGLRKGGSPIDLHKDTAGFIDGWTAPRWRAEHVKDGALPEFPDMMEVIKKCRQRGTVKPTFAMKPRYLLRAALAVGLGGGHGTGEFGVQIHRDTVDGPLLIAREYQEGAPVPPFALIMPMYTAVERREADALKATATPTPKRKKAA